MTLPKHLQIKRENHYVWGKYVKSWESTKRNYVWHTTKNGKIVCDSIKLILKEREFYKYRYITKESEYLIKWVSKSSHNPSLEENIESILQDFLLFQKIKYIYKNQRIQDKNFLDHIHAYENNTIENLHTTHENNVEHILESLKKLDFTVLESTQNRVSFMIFFGQQIARTKAFKEMCITGILNRYLKKTYEESWWLISYIYGLNLGLSFFYSYHTNERHCILINETDEDFMTSDHPIINVHQELNDDDLKIPLEHQSDFFYAISPKLGYMINNSDRFSSGINYVSKEFVQEMNIKLATYSNKHIISTSSEQLKKYKKYVGKRLKVINN